MAKGKKEKKKTNSKVSTNTNEPSKEWNNVRSKNWICFPVLGFSLLMVVPLIISAVFPALIYSNLSSFSGFEFYSQVVDPFELGELAGIIIAGNVIVLGSGIIYYKKRLSLKKLFDFDVSNKVAWVIVAIILVMYAAISAGEVSTPEIWADFEPIKERIYTASDANKFPIEDIIAGNPNFSESEPHVKFTLLYFSYDVLGNIKILPFIASIALLLITYLLTTKLTSKRIAGIFSLVILLQTNIFLTFDTSATYSNFWIVFYLVSLWLILKRWQLSHASFILSIFSKALSIAFLPLTMFFIFRNTISKKRLYLLASYGVLIIIGLGVFSLISSETEGTKYLPENVWKGFAASAYQLRFDPIILVFLLPLVVTLFLKSRAGFIQADSISVLLAGVLLIPSLLLTFTTQTNEPHRLMPLVVFFAIGAGTLLAKIRQPDELLSR